MSLEMEVPKILWLKNHMPSELFSDCKFYDLVDALTHIATGGEARSFSSMVCKQAYLPKGVEGSTTGWQKDFLEEIGLGELANGGFSQIGGVNGEVSRLLLGYPYNSFLTFYTDRSAFKRGRTCRYPMRKGSQRARPPSWNRDRKWCY